MKVVLVVPYRAKSQVLQILAPMGLGYLARALKNHGHDVVVLDSLKEELDRNSFIDRIKDLKPEVVGFTMFTPDVLAVQEMSKAVKDWDSSVITCGGGPHPSGDPEGVLNMLPAIDYVMKGEGELSFPMLLDSLEKDKLTEETKRMIPGLAYREGETITQNHQHFSADLDDCGYTLWGPIDPLEYQKYPPTLFVRKRPFAPIIITRGCPFRCTYCSGYNVTGRKIRSRSIKHVMKEIKELYNDYGIREFHIEDDNFTWNRQYVRDFCKTILEEKLNISWTMPNGVRLDSLDRETLRMMKKAGCYMLIVGIESGSERILKLMKKALSIKMIEEKVALAHEEGFFVHGFFMLGFPGETMEDMQATLDLALRIKLTGANFHIFQPLPGTEVTDSLIEAGKINGLNYDPYKATYANVVYVPEGLDSESIKKMQRKMLTSFYLRPRVIFRYLVEVIRSGNLIPFIKKAITYLK